MSKRSTRFSLGVKNEQADAGRDCRTRFGRPKSQARTGSGKKTCFPVQLHHEQDWQPYSFIDTLRLKI